MVSVGGPDSAVMQWRVELPNQPARSAHSTSHVHSDDDLVDDITSVSNSSIGNLKDFSEPSSLEHSSSTGLVPMSSSPLVQCIASVPAALSDALPPSASVATHPTDPGAATSVPDTRSQGSFV